VERGPLEVLVLSFPHERVPEGVEAALDAMREVGDIRIISGFTVTRPHEGEPTATQIAAIDDVGDLVADVVGHAMAGFVGADAIDEVVRTIEPGSTAVLVIVEHVWAVGIAAEIREADGELIDSVRLPRQLLAAAEAAMATPERSEG
jgi:uncharacterized membrane protein